MNKKKDAVLSSRFDWTGIDWSQVDERKADLIYSEARQLQAEVRESINSMNSKIFQMMAITISLITVCFSVFIINWATLSLLFRVSAGAFLFFLLIAAFAYIAAIWPKGIRYSVGGPSDYFTGNYYKNDNAEIVYGNIITAQENVTINKSVLKVRSRLFKAGLLFLFLAYASAVLPLYAAFFF